MNAVPRPHYNREYNPSGYERSEQQQREQILRQQIAHLRYASYSLRGPQGKGEYEFIRVQSGVARQKTDLVSAAIYRATAGVASNGSTRVEGKRIGRTG